METFSYHCPSCGSELKLNVFSQRLVCSACGKDYNPATLTTENYISTPDSDGSTNGGSTQEKIFRNFVEMNLYHCGSCGSEVVANDVEISKICSFCGQSAIVYDRATKVDKPDLIIPFKIGKEEAIDALKQKYKKAKCLPKEFDEISIDSVYAIYVPYYVFKAHYSVTGHINIRNDKKTVTKYFNGSDDRYVFMDSSRKLNDAASIYLNPFPYGEAVPFEPTYLTGYYADIADVDADTLRRRVKNYIWEIVSEQLISQVPELRNREVREKNQEMYAQMAASGLIRKLEDGYYVPVNDTEEFAVESEESVLCPVYLVTFNTSDGLANILINGATGKIVGSIPADEKKISRVLVRNCVLWAIIMAAIFGFSFVYTPIFWIGGIAAIVAFSVGMAGIKVRRKYEQLKHDMNTSYMFSLRRR